MSLGEYAGGALLCSVTLAATLGAAATLLGRRLGHLRGAPRALAFTVLAVTALVAAGLIPAALGILSRLTEPLCALLLLGAATRLPRRAEPAEPPRSVPPSSRPSVVVAALALAATALFELVRLRGLATHPLTDIDMLSFHMPDLAAFIQSGTIWRVEQFLPGFATAQYPANGEFLLAAFVIPWHDLAFVRLVAAAFFPLTALATYALGVELGATRAASVTLATAASALPAFTLLALDGLPDGISLCLFVSALLFGARYLRTRRRAELALAGLALGVSFGTKWYGLTAGAVVVVIWLLAEARTRRWRALGPLAEVVGWALLGGGIWLVRNLVLSGNPLYPKAINLLGVHLFAGSSGDVIDRYGYTVARYLTNLHVLHAYLLPGFRSRVGITGLVLVAGLAGLVLVAVRALRGGRLGSAAPAWVPGPRVLLALVVAVGGMCADYAITPGSAYGLAGMPVQAFVNIRWLMPAFLTAAALAAVAATRLGRAGLLLELAALAGVADDLHLGPQPVWSDAPAVILALLVAAGLLAAAGPLRHRLRASGRPGLRRLAAAGALLVALAGIGRVVQHGFDANPYAAFDPTFAWIDARAPAGHRIGVTGVWDTDGLPPTLPAFGPRLGNRVAYVGRRVRASLHLPPDEAAFAREVRRGRYDLLLVGRQDPAGTTGWARALGFRPVARSSRLELLASPAALRQPPSSR